MTDQTRDALYRRIHALSGLVHHGKAEQCFPITDAVLSLLATPDPAPSGYAPGMAFGTGGNRLPDPAPSSETPEGERVDALDAAYRERNALVAALIRSNGYPAEVVMAPDTEGWWIVYATTPAGQVSWHISPDDMDLFSDWPVAFGSRRSPWDGHTTEEKYRRVAALSADGWRVERAVDDAYNTEKGT